MRGEGDSNWDPIVDPFVVPFVVPFVSALGPDCVPVCVHLLDQLGDLVVCLVVVWLGAWLCPGWIAGCICVGVPHKGFSLTQPGLKTDPNGSRSWIQMDSAGSRYGTNWGSKMIGFLRTF